MKIFYWVGCLAALLALTVSCNEAPKNDVGTKDGPVNIRVGTDEIVQLKNANNILDYHTFSNPGETSGELSASEQALKAKNLNAPILYGVGAGGITMETTFAESRALLTPPLRGPDDDGAAIYNEQLLVYWHADGERKPQVIIVRTGYKGGLDAGKFGTITSDTKFTAYKGGNIDASAQKLTRELYRVFENTVDKDYDCLLSRRCQVVIGTKDRPYFTMLFPGAVLFVAKAEFQIIQMSIRKDSALGVLAGNFDILSGEIFKEGQESFKLSQTSEEILDRVKADPATATPQSLARTNGFVNLWSGFAYIFNRTNYVASAIQPEPTDFAKVVQFAAEYPGYMMLEGKRILMTQKDGKISFALEETPDPVTADQDMIEFGPGWIESKMKMSSQVLPGQSQLFVSEFTEFLKGELSKKYSVVRSLISGIQNEDEINKDINSSILAYDPNDISNSIQIIFEFQEIQNRMGFYIVALVGPKVSPFDEVIFKGIVKATEKVEGMVPAFDQLKNPITDPKTGEQLLEKGILPHFSELVGVSLNSLVHLSDIDNLGRKEATATWVVADGPGKVKLAEITERVSYDEEGLFATPDEQRPVPRKQGAIAVGSQGTSLGLQIVGVHTDGNPLARVVSVLSAATYGKIQNFCDLGSSVELKIGMSDDEAIAELDRALDAKRAAQKVIGQEYECDYFKVEDNKGFGRVEEIYFPSDRLVVYFVKRRLEAVSVYMPINEVKPVSAGVSQ